MDNWNNFNIGLNPNMNRMYNFNPPAQHYEIIKVNGEAGARNFRMAPNSTALLLDETAALIWFAQTDGTGYLTVTPYDIVPHQQVPPVDINQLADRVTQLEELINAKSNSHTNRQLKKNKSESIEPTINTTN